MVTNGMAEIELALMIKNQLFLDNHKDATTLCSFVFRIDECKNKNKNWIAKYKWLKDKLWNELYCITDDTKTLMQDNWFKQLFTCIDDSCCGFSHLFCAIHLLTLHASSTLPCDTMQHFLINKKTNQSTLTDEQRRTNMSKKPESSNDSLLLNRAISEVCVFRASFLDKELEKSCRDAFMFYDDANHWSITLAPEKSELNMQKLFIYVCSLNNIHASQYHNRRFKNKNRFRFIQFEARILLANSPYPKQLQRIGFRTFIIKWISTVLRFSHVHRIQCWNDKCSCVGLGCIFIFFFFFFSSPLLCNRWVCIVHWRLNDFTLYKHDAIDWCLFICSVFFLLLRLAIEETKKSEERTIWTTANIDKTEVCVCMCRIYNYCFATK